MKKTGLTKTGTSWETRYQRTHNHRDPVFVVPCRQVPFSALTLDLCVHRPSVTLRTRRAHTETHALFLESAPNGRAWHRGSQYASSDDFRPIDCKDRFRVWLAAQALDRRTHKKGRHGGMLGHSGLALLRSLLFDFINLGTGRLDPTYESLAERTGYSRDTMIEAMKRLVAAGIIEKTNRIIRERVKAWCELAGREIWMWRVRQRSNAYRVNFPLPDRRDQGDLRLPLLRPCFTGIKAESERPTGTTPVSTSKALEGVEDPRLRAALERMKAMIDAKDGPEASGVA